MDLNEYRTGPGWRRFETATPDIDIMLNPKRREIVQIDGDCETLIACRTVDAFATQIGKLAMQYPPKPLAG